MIPEKSRSAKMRTEYPQDIHNGAKYPPCINKLSTRAGREEGTSERESLEAAQDFQHLTLDVPAGRKVTVHLAPGGGCAVSFLPE